LLRGCSAVEKRPVRTRMHGGVGVEIKTPCLPECAEHVQQLGGESPLPNLMEVKG
jgi:hypothetical protein